MRKIFKHCYTFFLLIPALYADASDTTTIVSPDKNIEFRLFKQGIQLSYRITFKGIEVIQSSPLIASLDKVSITENNEIGQLKTYSVKENYPWYGTHSTAVNECNGGKIPVKSKQLTYTIDVRVFNDGAAFQLNIPGDPCYFTDSG